MNNALDEDWFGRDGVFNVEEGRLAEFIDGAFGAKLK